MEILKKIYDPEKESKNLVKIANELILQADTLGDNLSEQRWELRKKALRLYDGAIRKNPNNIAGWFRRACLLYQLGDANKALINYDHVISVDPKNLAAWRGRLSCLDRGLHKEREDAIDHILELDPKDADAWYGKAYFLSCYKKREDAINAYENVILYDDDKISNRKPYLLKCKADLLKELGRIEEALIIYEKLLSETPSDEDEANILVSKAEIFEKLNRYGEALEAYQLSLITIGDIEDIMYPDKTDIKRKILKLQKHIKPQTIKKEPTQIINISGEKVHIGNNKTIIRDSVLTRSNISTDCGVEDSTCPDCGGDVPQNLKFCGNCGTRIR